MRALTTDVFFAVTVSKSSATTLPRIAPYVRSSTTIHDSFPAFATCSPALGTVAWGGRHSSSVQSNLFLQQLRLMLMLPSRPFVLDHPSSLSVSRRKGAEAQAPRFTSSVR
jgi:hypothetical protein